MHFKVSGDGPGAPCQRDPQWAAWLGNRHSTGRQDGYTAGFVRSCIAAWHRRSSIVAPNDCRRQRLDLRHASVDGVATLDDDPAQSE